MPRHTGSPHDQFFCFTCLEYFEDSNARVRCPNWCDVRRRTISREELRGLNWNAGRTICQAYDLDIYVRQAFLWFYSPGRPRRWACNRCAATVSFEEGELRRCHRCGASHRWLSLVTWDRQSLAPAQLR